MLTLTRLAKLTQPQRYKRFWTFRATSDSRVGELLLYGPISDYTWFGDEVTPKQFHDDLAALGDINELRVYINSPGGDVFAAQAIHSMLQRHPARVTVYIDGLAASAASLIVVAGDRVIMPRNAMLMIHNPWTLAFGDAVEFRAVADALDQIREAMIAAYASKSGLDRATLVDLLDAETWMTAEEAVEYRFADEIEGKKQVVAFVRDGRWVINGQEFDLAGYWNLPKLGFFSLKGNTALDGASPKTPPGNVPEGGGDRLKLLAFELELLTGNSVE